MNVIHFLYESKCSNIWSRENKANFFPENTDNKGVSLNCFNLIRTSVLHLNLYSIQYDMNNRRYSDVRFLN